MVSVVVEMMPHGVVMPMVDQWVADKLCTRVAQPEDEESHREDEEEPSPNHRRTHMILW